MAGLPDILVSLFTGVVSSGLIALADRKDQQKRAEIASLCDSLEDPHSKLVRALHRAATNVACSESLKEQLEHACFDEVNAAAVADAVFDKLPSSSLTTAICSAIRSCVPTPLATDNELETAIRELVHAFSHDVLSNPATASLWLSSQMEAMETTLRASIEERIASPPSSRNSVKTVDAVLTPHTRVSLGHLPVTRQLLIGREQELALIDYAWASGACRILNVVAWGGVGKSALVNSWLRRQQNHDFDGARVFGWSFYSQGTREDAAVSSEEFFLALAVFLGVRMGTPSNPLERMNSILQALRKRRTLLILDGLEPLQTIAEGHEGRFRDRTLRHFLRDLAWQSNGMALLTSRLPIRDLDSCPDTHVRNIMLPNLSVRDGCQLLVAHGFNADESRLEEVVTLYEGHALSLVLLAEYANEFGKPTVLYLTDAGLCPIGLVRTRTASDVLGAYDAMFAREGSSELQQLLRVIGIFDRPVPLALVHSIGAGPALPLLTDSIACLEEGAFSSMTSRLARLGLMATAVTGDSHSRMDCHPLVRDYFGQRAKEENCTGWKELHGRAYTWLANSVPQLPSTQAEMEILYEAIHHGCRAGLHQTALEDVYYPRIKRQNESYSTRHLGMFTADLAVLTAFFPRGWSSPAEGLKSSEPPYLLNEAGVALQALGRLDEAEEPLRLSLDILKSTQQWKLAAIRAGNRTELLLALGRLEAGKVQAIDGLKYARLAKSVRQEIVKLTRLAHVLHLLGECSEARSLFETAQLLETIPDDSPQLQGREAALFAELLIDQGHISEASALIEATLPATSAGASSLATAHCLLCASKALARRGHLRKARGFLDLAYDAFEQTSYQQFLLMPMVAAIDLRIAVRTDAHAVSQRISTCRLLV